jgi:hypothetical protein
MNKPTVIRDNNHQLVLVYTEAPSFSSILPFLGKEINRSEKPEKNWTTIDRRLLTKIEIDRKPESDSWYWVTLWFALTFDEEVCERTTENELRIALGLI